MAFVCFGLGCLIDHLRTLTGPTGPCPVSVPPRRGPPHLSEGTVMMERVTAATTQAQLRLDELDAEQAAAVRAPRGPVCVLAGAGTGKTRTITHRIAYLVSAGQVRADQVLAVTFTARAAGELRGRLRALGLGGAAHTVQARTFHAAALRQLRYFWPQVVGEVPWRMLDSKFAVVAKAAERVGMGSATEDVR